MALQIERILDSRFEFSLDGGDPISDNAPNLTTFGNICHFKTRNGANIIKDQNITYADVTVIDTYGGTGSFTFANVQNLWTKLIDLNFFVGISGSGGGSGVTRFDALLDAFTYFGNDGKVPVVDESQLKLVATTFYNFNEFTQLNDVSIETLIAGKILGVALVEGTPKIVLTDPIEESDQFVSAVGGFYYADLATQTTPLAYTTGDLQLENDIEGDDTFLTQPPYGITSVWDESTNTFDFSQLSIGDEIILRVDLNVTTSAANQTSNVKLLLGEGTADEKTIVLETFYTETAAATIMTAKVHFDIRNENQRTTAAKLLFSSDASADVKIVGFHPYIVRKSVNIVDISDDTFKTFSVAQIASPTVDTSTNAGTVKIGYEGVGDKLTNILFDLAFSKYLVNVDALLSTKNIEIAIYNKTKGKFLSAQITSFTEPSTGYYNAVLDEYIDVTDVAVNDVLDINISVGVQASGGGTAPIPTTYADLSALVAAQGAQTTNYIYEVTDGSGFTGVSSGAIWVKYLGTTVGDETDYIIISKAVNSGGGDMLASTYDPNNVEGDAFDMDNMVEGADTKILTAAERAAIASHTSEIAALVSSYSRRKAVIDIVDNTAAPPTEVSGDRYILDNTGASHANWDGASAFDIVEFDGTNWVATTPLEGYIAYVDSEDKDALYIDDGSPEWQLRDISAFDLAAAINGATNKATPVDADKIGIWDSVSGLLRNITWANIKATLKTYFDTLYFKTDAEVETAYNAQVDVVLQAEAEAGTSTTVRRWTAERVKQAIEALSSEVSSTTHTHEQLLAATTWSIAHNLGNPFPLITVYNYSGEQIIPEKVESIDSNNLEVTLPTAIKGYASLFGTAFTPTPPPLPDTDAQAFIDAVGTLDSGTQDAVDVLVKGLKIDGIWSKLLLLNIKAGSTAAEHKWNLKDPRDLDAAFRYTYTGGWTHSSAGAASNGSTAFADTKLNLAAQGLDQDLTMGVYITVAPSTFGDKYIMGAHSGANNFTAIQRGSSTSLTFVANASGAATQTVNPTTGFVAMTVNGTTKVAYAKGSVLETVSTNGSSVANVNVYEGALNLGGRYGALPLTMGTSFIGQYLTNAELALLQSRIITFETALGRNV